MIAFILFPSIQKKDQLLESDHEMFDYMPLSLSELNPNTKYELVVQARIGDGDYSKDNATLVFRTNEAGNWSTNNPIL